MVSLRSRFCASGEIRHTRVDHTIDSHISIGAVSAGTKRVIDEH